MQSVGVAALPLPTDAAPLLAEGLTSDQGGADESLNGKLSDECVSLEWFRSRTEARAVIEDWRRHYTTPCGLTPA